MLRSQPLRSSLPGMPNCKGSWMKLHNLKCMLYRTTSLTRRMVQCIAQPKLNALLSVPGFLARMLVPSATWSPNGMFINLLQMLQLVSTPRHSSARTPDRETVRYWTSHSDRSRGSRGLVPNINTVFKAPTHAKQIRMQRYRRAVPMRWGCQSGLLCEAWRQR